uniref:Uncharacterized protein n=1 Tax=viral metagenome TaxID=1070528 RepID=A0A6M3M6M9_9ZZZZ
MDILCTRCGEPWDVFSLVDDMSPEEAKDLKAGQGCPCCAEKEKCDKDIACEECPEYLNSRCQAKKFKPINDDGRYVQKALADILGDDIDGLAAEMEDAGFT